MSPSEVVVIFASDAEALPESVALAESDAGANRLGEILQDFGAQLEPILDAAAMPEAAAEGTAAQTEAEAELARYYRTEVDDEAAEALAERLRQLPQVEGAYVTPPTRNPIAPFDRAAAEAAVPIPADAPPGAIPDFSRSQGYMGPAPGGVNARMAWNDASRRGTGQGVKVIDIEGGWCLTHVDLQPNGGLVGTGTVYPERYWRDHGTAVMGEVIGRNNGFGIAGLAPDAQMAVTSHGGIGSAKAIQQAAALLSPGDILLLEMHRAGPRYNFVDREDQLGLIAVEWWQQDYFAIRLAIERGIIVVEAAGNGAENLDDRIYDRPMKGFTSAWRNPFRGAADSGAILVGAGCPPSGNYGPDRSRLDFSNHGSRVDCQAWGREVVTTGYGDLWRIEPEHESYTGTFSGTSSASPIVVGVLACLQGIARARGRPLNPARARQLLRMTGSAQQASGSAPLTQRIGTRPDLAALIPMV